MHLLANLRCLMCLFWTLAVVAHRNVLPAARWGGTTYTSTVQLFLGWSGAEYGPGGCTKRVCSSSRVADQVFQSPPANIAHFGISPKDSRLRPLLKASGCFPLSHCGFHVAVGGRRAELRSLLHLGYATRVQIFSLRY